MGIKPCTSDQLIKALLRVGLEVVAGQGKGSHIKIRDPKSQHSTTVPNSRGKDLSQVRNAIVKTVVGWGYKKKEILRSMK